jgi:hypothetical protein
MATHGYSYQETLATSEKITWRIEDIIGGGKTLDFAKPFMPESLARVQGLAFLSPGEQRVLNQIRGHAYLCIFGLVEEFILPFVLDHARPRLQGDDHQVRALLNFAGEEAKHIHLFKVFRAEFERDFGHHCDVIGPPEAIAKAVLAHHPLGVALAILHIEWMTQRHYVDSIKDAQELDPQFKSLLKHHWMEEAQHAKLDTLMAEAIAAKCSPAEIEQGVGDYLKIGMLIDGGLEAQTKFDLAALERVTGRRLGESQSREAFEQQRQANRWTYLGSGMTHPNFLATLGSLSPAGRKQVEGVAPAFC